MQPTLNPDTNQRKRDILFVQKSAVFIDRGHIITFWSPRHENKLITKRVIGLPGDLVRVDKRRFQLMDTDAEFIQVPPGHIWVEGDAFHSSDSNVHGPVPFACVDGKAQFILWPWNRLGAGPLKQIDVQHRIIQPQDQTGEESIVSFESFWWNWSRG